MGKSTLSRFQIHSKMCPSMRVLWMILLTKILLTIVLNPTLTISSFIVNIFVMVWLRGLYVGERRIWTTALALSVCCSACMVPHWPVVVSQSAEQSLPIPEVCSLNPVISITYWLSTNFFEKKKTKKRLAMEHFKHFINNFTNFLLLKSLLKVKVFLATKIQIYRKCLN